MAAQRSTSVSADTLVFTGRCYLHELYVEAGDDTAAVVIANAVSTGGTRVSGCRSQATNERSRSFPGLGEFFTTGIFATVTGTSPVVEIVYSEA